MYVYIYVCIEREGSMVTNLKQTPDTSSLVYISDALYIRLDDWHTELMGLACY